MKVINFPVIAAKKLKRIAADHCLDYIARSNLKQLKYKKKTDKCIKVLFVVQMPEIWNKQCEVFKLMKESDLFIAQLIIVPKYDFINGTIGEYGNELEFFRSYDEQAVLIDEINDYESFIESYDYVFYQREYDLYLPKALQSKSVIKHTKTCYIPYSTPETIDTVLYSKGFYRYIYMGFMDTEYAREVIEAKFKCNVRNGLQKFIYAGYPPFETVLNMDDTCLYKRILWAPRWAYGANCGGSHFFEYKDLINLYAKVNPNIDVCIRPHPLMFENFIKEKMMTEGQVEEYKREVVLSNASMDTNGDIFDTFVSTDILISDLSSLIPLFFLTGKPVIYCPKKVAGYSLVYETIFSGLYVANNEKELKYHIDNLVNSKDELRELRLSIIEKNFRSNKNASRKIVDEIYSDYCRV